MKRWMITPVVIILLFGISFVQSEIGSEDENRHGVEITIPPTPINYSLIPTVNSSEWWDDRNNVNATQFENNDGTLSIITNWVESFGNGLWCALTGCVMTGDIQMGNNNINGSGNFTTTGIGTFGRIGLISTDFSLIENDVYIELVGDGVIEGGLGISIPQTVGSDFYYGYGGGESHRFGRHGEELIIDEDGNIITTGNIKANDLYAVSPNGLESVRIYHTDTTTFIKPTTAVTSLKTSKANTKTVWIVQGTGTGEGRGQFRSGDSTAIWFMAAANGGSCDLDVSVGTQFNLLGDAVVPINIFPYSTEGETQIIRQYGFGTGCGANSYLQRQVEVDACDTTTWSKQDQYRFVGDLNVTGTIINEAIYCESSDLNDQTFATAGVRYRLNISNIDEGNGITMESGGNNGTNISIDVSGVYHLVAQPQVKAGAGGAGDFHMWIEKFNSTGWFDISDSNIELKLSSLEEDVIVLATTLKLNQGEKLRLVVSVSDNKILLHAQSPVGEPVIPSIIFTMYRVGS